MSIAISAALYIEGGNITSGFAIFKKIFSGTLNKLVNILFNISKVIIYLLCGGRGDRTHSNQLRLYDITIFKTLSHSHTFTYLILYT